MVATGHADDMRVAFNIFEKQLIAGISDTVICEVVAA
jgi:hypothetical protein